MCGYFCPSLDKLRKPLGDSLEPEKWGVEARPKTHAHPANHDKDMKVP